MLVSPARTARLLIALALVNLGVVTALAVGGPPEMTGSSGGQPAAPSRAMSDPFEPALSSATVIPLPTPPPGTPGPTVAPTATSSPTPTAMPTPRAPARTRAPQTDTEP